MASSFPFSPAQQGRGFEHTPLFERWGASNRVGSGRQTYVEPLDQATRHVHNAYELRKLLVSTKHQTFFLPNPSGDFTPAFLEFIASGRAFTGDIHARAGGSYLKSSFIDAQISTCVHGLGCADLLIKSKNALEVTRRLLEAELASHELPPHVFSSLALLFVASLMYAHDTAEDAQKLGRKLPEEHPDKAFFLSITPALVAQKMLEKAPVPHAEKLIPILTRHLKAFTDKAKYDERDRDERIAAQQIAPRKEFERLLRLNIIDGNPWFFGPITGGKFADKFNQLLIDTIVLATGHQSLHEDVNAFLSFQDPRYALVSSLYIPDTHKSLYDEFVSASISLLRNPLTKQLSPEMAVTKVLKPVLTHIASTLGDWKPYKPLLVRQKLISIPQSSHQLNIAPTVAAP